MDTKIAGLLLDASDNDLVLASVLSCYRNGRGLSPADAWSEYIKLQMVLKPTEMQTRGITPFNPEVKEGAFVQQMRSCLEYFEAGDIEYLLMRVGLCSDKFHFHKNDDEDTAESVQLPLFGIMDGSIPQDDFLNDVKLGIQVSINDRGQETIESWVLVSLNGDPSELSIGDTVYRESPWSEHLCKGTVLAWATLTDGEYTEKDKDNVLDDDNPFIRVQYQGFRIDIEYWSLTEPVFKKEGL